MGQPNLRRCLVFFYILVNNPNENGLFEDVPPVKTWGVSLAMLVYLSFMIFGQMFNINTSHSRRVRL